MKIYSIFAFSVAFLAFVLIMALKQASAQDDWHLVLKGKVLDKEKNSQPIKKAKIYVENEGSKFLNIKTNNEGEFEIKLNPDGDYILTFSSSKKVSKKLSFNTYNVPPNDTKGGDFAFHFDVTLFEKEKGIDYSVLEEPLVRVFYYEEFHDFDYDTEYMRVRKEALNKLQNEMKK